MITQRLTRDWRIRRWPHDAYPYCGLHSARTLGCFHPVCLATQITLHRYLVMYLLQFNNHQYSGGLWLLTGAFFYGVLTLSGQHGKFIVTTYISVQIKRANWLPGSFFWQYAAGRQRHSVCLYSKVGFNPCVRDISTSRWYVEKISAVLIGAFGAFIIFTALKACARAGWQFRHHAPFTTA